MIPGASFAIFLIILSALLGGVNYLIVQVLGDITGVNTSILGWVTGSLTAGFILISIIGNFFYNIFTRVIYIITAVWLSLFTYLFLGSALYGVIVTIGLFAFPEASFQTIGIVIMIIAVLTTLYGVIHARSIKIKKITVNIPEWNGKKAVWISDLHLGQVRGFHFSQKVTKLVNSLTPDVIFVGGDLFDGTLAPNCTEIASPLQNLSAPLGKYFIAGNHEEITHAEEFLIAAENTDLDVLRDKMVVVEGVQIVGVEYTTAHNTDNFKKILAGLSIDRSMSSILLKHEPRDLHIAHEAGITFSISGHTHKGQQWPFGHIANKVYKGYGYGLKMFKTMQAYVSSGVGGWGPPVRVNSDCEIVLISFE